MNTIFESFDRDGDERIGSEELAATFAWMRERSKERRGDSVEQLEREPVFQDAWMGTPEAAGSFIVDNFDEDGDWVLDRAELATALASVRTWRRTELEERGIARNAR